MANEPDITIGLKTVADTSGAEETTQAIQEVDEQISETRENQERASESAKKQAESIEKIEMASKALVAVQAVEFLKKATSQIREAAKEGGILHDQLGDMGDAMDGLDNALNTATAGLTTFAATGNPVLAMLAAAGAGVAGLADAYSQYKQSTKDAAEAESRLAEMPAFLEKRRQYMRDHADELSQLKSIHKENEALHSQEDSFRRMIDLRKELAGQAQTAAQQEIELAKLKGGDVALAEANAIATDMQSSIQALNDKLATAQRDMAQAGSDELRAVGDLRAAQEKVAAGLATAESVNIKGLEDVVKDTADKGAEARKNLTGVLATYDAAHLNILRKAEIQLEKKEKEYEGQTSVAAGKAFQQVYNTVKTELSKGPEESKKAIAAIAADAATVTTAAQAKADEVSAAMEAAKAVTVQSIQQVGTTSQQSSDATNQAVSKAANQITQSLDLLTNHVITSLSKVAANGIANANKIAAQQAQINQLFARSR